MLQMASGGKSAVEVLGNTATMAAGVLDKAVSGAQSRVGDCSPCCSHTRVPAPQQQPQLHRQALLRCWPVIRPNCWSCLWIAIGFPSVKQHAAEICCLSWPAPPQCCTSRPPAHSPHEAPCMAKCIILVQYTHRCRLLSTGITTS